MTMRGENNAEDSSPMSPSRNLHGEENLADKRSTVKTSWNVAGNSNVDR